MRLYGGYSATTTPSSSETSLIINRIFKHQSHSQQWSQSSNIKTSKNHQHNFSSGGKTTTQHLWQYKYRLNLIEYFQQTKCVKVGTFNRNSIWMSQFGFAVLSPSCTFIYVALLKIRMLLSSMLFDRNSTTRILAARRIWWMMGNNDETRLEWNLSLGNGWNGGSGMKELPAKDCLPCLAMLAGRLKLRWNSEQLWVNAAW